LFRSFGPLCALMIAKSKFDTPCFRSLIFGLTAGSKLGVSYSHSHRTILSQVSLVPVSWCSIHSRAWWASSFIRQVTLTLRPPSASFSTSTDSPWGNWLISHCLHFEHKTHCSTYREHRLATYTWLRCRSSSPSNL
jgi:hypothetical protein